MQNFAWQSVILLLIFYSINIGNLSNTIQQVVRELAYFVECDTSLKFQSAQTQLSSQIVKIFTAKY